VGRLMGLAVVALFALAGAAVILRGQWRELRASFRRAREAWGEFRRDSSV